MKAEKNNPSKSNGLKVLVTFGTMILLMALYYAAGFFGIMGNTEMTEKELVKIDKLVLSQFPVKKSNKSNYWLSFHCVGYEKDFSIGNLDYKCCDIDGLLNTIRTGDTITVGVKKGDLSSMHDKSYLVNRNEVYLFSVHGHEYCDLDCSNAKRASTSLFGMIGFFALSLVFFGAALIYKKRMNRA